MTVIFCTGSQMYAAPSAMLFVRSMEAFTASASTGRPVWKTAPLRSVNVHVLPSGDAFHSSARRALARLVRGL